ncbi:MAG: hypothetical protein D4R73_03695 [Deltaproteobacteria bacterium]|nr:MAG: hypothetical protein D4R73_03695 [Deltaproteobacteria bacterium]
MKIGQLPATFQGKAMPCDPDYERQSIPLIKPPKKLSRFPIFRPLSPVHCCNAIDKGLRPAWRPRILLTTSSEAEIGGNEAVAANSPGRFK